MLDGSSVLSNNLPADSLHSGFLHSHLHCLGQYRKNLCRTNLCTIEYISVQNLPSLVSPLFVTMSNQGVGDYEILNCYRAIYYEHRLHVRATQGQQGQEDPLCALPSLRKCFI